MLDKYLHKQIMHQTFKNYIHEIRSFHASYPELILANNFKYVLFNLKRIFDLHLNIFIFFLNFIDVGIIR